MNEQKQHWFQQSKTKPNQFIAINNFNNLHNCPCGVEFKIKKISNRLTIICIDFFTINTKNERKDSNMLIALLVVLLKKKAIKIVKY